MTDEEIKDVAEAADDLGERMVEVLADETGREPEEFEIDPDDCEFPDPDA
jgi:ATP-dependent protease ClpP protease subunit